MNSSGMAFGHAASHSAWLEQLPKSSPANGRYHVQHPPVALGLALRERIKCVTFAAVNSMAGFHPGSSLRNAAGSPTKTSIGRGW